MARGNICRHKRVRRNAPLQQTRFKLVGTSTVVVLLYCQFLTHGYGAGVYDCEVQQLLSAMIVRAVGGACTSSPRRVNDKQGHQPVRIMSATAMSSHHHVHAKRKRSIPKQVGPTKAPRSLLSFPCSTPSPESQKKNMERERQQQLARGG